MVEKFNNLSKFNRTLIIILGVLIICTILYLICFDRTYNNIKFPDNNWESTSSENESSSADCSYNDLSENNYCQKNKTQMFNIVLNTLNQTLITEYFPEDINELKNNYEVGYNSCDNTCYISDGKFGLFSININNNTLQLSNFDGEFSKIDDIKNELEHTGFFEHSKDLIKEDYVAQMKQIDSNIAIDSIGIYPVTKDSELGRYFVIEIRDYKTETDNSGKLYITYTIDLKNKSFTKIIK